MHHIFICHPIAADSAVAFLTAEKVGILACILNARKRQTDWQKVRKVIKCSRTCLEF